jgi:hypothetical protein
MFRCDPSQFLTLIGMFYHGLKSMGTGEAYDARPTEGNLHLEKEGCIF